MHVTHGTITWKEWIDKKMEPILFSSPGSRICKIAFPLLSLYRGFSVPFAYLSISGRLVECYKTALLYPEPSPEIPFFMKNRTRAWVAIAALALTFFGHPCGMILLASFDLLHHGSRVYSYRKKVKTIHVLEAANPVLYVTALVFKSFKASILCLGVQAGLGFYYAWTGREEDRHPETVTKLAFAMYRTFEFFTGLRSGCYLRGSFT